MPYHLLRTRYTANTWASIAQNPEDRTTASKAGAADYGGELVGYWYSTGRYDCYSLLWAPDVLTAGALRTALFSSGAFLEFHSSVLLTTQEMKAVVGKVHEWPMLRDYRPPGQKAPATED